MEANGGVNLGVETDNEELRSALLQKESGTSRLAYLTLGIILHRWSRKELGPRRRMFVKGIPRKLYAKAGPPLNGVKCQA